MEKLTHQLSKYKFFAQDIGSALTQFAKIAVEQRDRQEKILKPLIDAGRPVFMTLKPIGLIDGEALKLASLLSSSAGNALKDFAKTMEPIRTQLRDSFNELPVRLQRTLFHLSENGWFLDTSISIAEFSILQNLIEQGDFDEVERFLLTHFENKLDQIENLISKRFPNRQKIIKSAFNAHRRGEYELSVPVLLSQTDGICNEVAKGYLFMRTNKKPQVARFVESLNAYSLKAIILSPLVATLPINASEKERPDGFTGLNRHMVLHGDSLDYGTHVKSLKSISLMNYIVQCL